MLGISMWIIREEKANLVSQIPRLQQLDVCDYEYVIWFMIPTIACFVKAGSALADIYSKYAIGWKRVKVIVSEVYDWLKDNWNRCVQPCISDEIPNKEKCIEYIRLSQLFAIV